MTLTHSESINEIAAAFSKAQAEMKGAAKDSANPFFKSKYADLASVREASFPALTKYGLAILQSPRAEGATVTVETILMHTSGQWFRGELTVTAKEDGPQAVGSAITYARRYSLAAFAGIAPEDDDGEAAEARNKQQAKPQTAPKGYDDWVSDLAVVAQDGTEALQAVWKQSKAEYRNHLTSTNPKGWESLKQIAASRVPTHA